jgi:hypothetical protein
MIAQKTKRPKTDTLVWTSSQLCRALGISSAELSRRTLDGAILGRVGFGRYNAIVAVRSMIESLTADLSRTAQDGGSAIRAARLRWFESRASIAELELAQRRGELLNAAEVTQALRSAMATMRNRLLSVPSHLGPRIAATTDAVKCAQLLREQISAALEDLANATVVVTKSKVVP